MTSRVKRSAIPASGYMYQTLVGIRVLCSWLDNPGMYEWVQFEADDLQEARGLDDIIASRADKLLELIQVKFTVAPFEPVNALSWDWLTERKGVRGKSLLEKWSSAAFGVGLENTAELRLITNRRPDAEFTAHLRDGKVLLEALPEALREEIEVHVGDARTLCASLKDLSLLTVTWGMNRWTEPSAQLWRGATQITWAG